MPAAWGELPPWGTQVTLWDPGCAWQTPSSEKEPAQPCRLEGGQGRLESRALRNSHQWHNYNF